MMTIDYQPNQVTKRSVVSQLLSYLDITVVIPTYNGAERIPQVLDALKCQEQIEGITWEVIVCDNNSCDRTADVVAVYQQNWLQDIPLRYCFVAEQGAAFARQRGVVKAGGDIIAFLDDDNIPAQDWVRNVYQFADTYPQAGAFGSQIHGDFQGELPEEFGHIACFLAIVERGSQPHLYQPKSKILPPAAGLAVRKQAWLDAVPERLFLNHKGKSAGLASEDLEAILHIQQAGWEIWYNSDMVVTHQIPSQRLQQEYLVTLLRCIGLSKFYIRWLGTKDWQRFFKVSAYIANDLRKLAFHYLKNGPQANLTTVAACERSLLTSTLISPAFLLHKAYQDFWQTRHDNLQLPERQQWLHRLTDAFENRHLELYQQEVVCLDSAQAQATGQATPRERLRQFEVLLRLRQNLPEQPLAFPAAFLPTAERYGLMRTLDRRVIQQVCELFGLRPLTALYSLNLSGASVFDPDFLDFVDDQLQRNQVIPERLCFELPVSAVVKGGAVVQARVERMKQLGLRVAIDDISDISIFNHPITSLADCLKLNQAVLPRTHDVAGDTILTQLIQLSQARGIQLVAKGVESQAVIDYLQFVGIHYVQGYYCLKPEPLTPLEAA